MSEIFLSQKKGLTVGFLKGYRDYLLSQKGLVMETLEGNKMQLKQKFGNTGFNIFLWKK